MTPEQILARIEQISGTIPPMSWAHKDQAHKVEQIVDLKARYEQLRRLEVENAALQREVGWLRVIGDRMLLDIEQNGGDQIGQIRAIWRSPVGDL